MLSENEIALFHRDFLGLLSKLVHFHRKDAGGIGAFPYEVLTCEKHSTFRLSFSYFAGRCLSLCCAKRMKMRGAVRPSAFFCTGALELKNTCEKHSTFRLSFSYFAALHSGRNRTVPNIAGDFGESFLLFSTD